MSRGTVTRMLTIEDRVLELLRELTDADPGPHDHLVRDLGLDSLDLVELGLRLEEEFELDSIPDAIVWGTVSDVIDYLQSQEDAA